MGEDRLNKYIKDKIHDHQTPVDLDSFWQGIEQKQAEKEEPKRRFFWWFFFGGLLLVAGSLLPTVWGSDSLKKEEIVQQETPSIAKTSKVLDEVSSPIARQANVDEKVADANLLKEEKATSLPINQVKENTENLPYLSKINKNAINNNSSKLKDQQNTLNKATRSAPSIPSPLSKNTLLLDGQLVTNALNLNPENQRSFLNKNDSFSADSTQNGVAQAKMNPTVNRTIATLQQKWLLLRLKALNPEPQSYLLPLNIEPKVVIDSSQQKLKWSIGAHFSYGQSQRKLNGIATYVATRNELETPEQVLSAGLDLQHQFKSGLYFKSGLIYEQITERFDLDRTTELEDFFNENGTNVIYRMGNGSTSIENGTTAQRQEIQFREVYNRYRTIDVPLMLGYTFIADKKWNWFAEAGVLVNLSFLPEGQILASDNDTFIQLDDNEILRSRAGWSLNVGIGVAYQLNENFSLWLSPRFRYGLTNMMQEGYVLEQSFQRIALQIGIRKKL